MDAIGTWVLTLTTVGVLGLIVLNPTGLVTTLNVVVGAVRNGLQVASGKR